MSGWLLVNFHNISVSKIHNFLLFTEGESAYSSCCHERSLWGRTDSIGCRVRGQHSRKGQKVTFISFHVCPYCSCYIQWKYVTFGEFFQMILFLGMKCTHLYNLHMLFWYNFQYVHIIAYCKFPILHNCLISWFPFCIKLQEYNILNAEFLS